MALIKNFWLKNKNIKGGIWNQKKEIMINGFFNEKKIQYTIKWKINNEKGGKAITKLLL